MRLLFSSLIRAYRGGSRYGVESTPTPPPPPPPEEPVDTTLLGVGSSSTSLVDYPKTGTVTQGDFYVDPTSGTNGTGAEGNPFNNLESALSAVSDGGTILVKAGTLTLSSRINRSTAWTQGVKVFNYGTDRPIINAGNLAAGDTGMAVRFHNGSQNEHWKGFEIINSPDTAVLLGGWNLMLEDVWAHHCMTSPQQGIAAIRSYGGGARNNLIQDCAVWRCGNGSTTGFNAPDAYQFTANSGEKQTGSKWVRCFAAHAADDAYDMFRGSNCESIDSVAYKSGYYWNGFNAQAGGSGWKLGGGETGIGENLVSGSIDIGSRQEGIKPNSTPLASDFLNSTCVQAEFYAFNMGYTGINPGEVHITRNNIAWDFVENDGGETRDYVDSAFNSWDLGITNPQFSDIANHDWSLAAGSPAIGAGQGGENLGASVVALEIAKEWLNKDLT